MSEIGSFSSSGIMTMARGRSGDLYGVNGVERGFRWDGITASVEQLGISPPASAPLVSATTGSPNYFVTGVDVIDNGFGYSKAPPITIAAPAGGVQAKGKAELISSAIARVAMQQYGSGYTSEPAVSVGAPDATSVAGSGAAFTAVLGGGIESLRVTRTGSGYTSAPAVRVAHACTGDETTDTLTCTAHGLEDGDTVRFPALTGGAGLSINTNYYVVAATANTFQVSSTLGGPPINFTTAITAGEVFLPPGGGSGSLLMSVLNGLGRVVEIVIINPGANYPAAPRVYIDPPASGVRAEATAVVGLGVISVTVTAGGSGYAGIPRLRFVSTTGSGAQAFCTVVNGSITAVTVTSPGIYRTVPSVSVDADPRLYNRQAVLKAVLTPGIVGKFWCAYRYVDDTQPQPIPSSISDFKVLELATPAQQLDWSGLSEGSEPRVANIELWRTTADQALTLYRVAILPPGTTSYTDRLSDADLANPERTLPCTGAASSNVITCAGHGMVNGRRVRFESLVGGAGLSTDVLYYVVDATVSTFRVSATAGGTPVDITTDLSAGMAVVDTFDAMPIVLPNGQPNARRFRLPPQNKSAVVMFQDRAWYAVDVAGRKYDGSADAAAAEPNKLYFSEIDEPESVPEPNELILQDNVNGSDRITALMPFGGAMVVFQERHCHRLSYASQPIIDASISLIAQRGCLNQRCFDTQDGVAYVADTSGIYVLDGSNAVPISDAIDTFWTEGVIHFASSAYFSVRCDPMTRVVRFHFGVSAGLPDRALCYHPITKAWWVEVYAQTLAATGVARTGGRHRVIAGMGNGSLLLADSGGADVDAAGASAAIACQYRTGSYPFDLNATDRRVRVIYDPTSADANLTLKLHFNNSATPRLSAIRTDRGDGFVTDSSSGAQLNMKSARSALGEATGYAACYYSGRLDDRSAGGDRHLAVDVSVSRPTTDGVTLYGMSVDGVSG